MSIEELKRMIIAGRVENAGTLIAYLICCTGIFWWSLWKGEDKNPVSCKDNYLEEQSHAIWRLSTRTNLLFKETTLVVSIGAGWPYSMPIVLLLFDIFKGSHNLCIFHSPLTLLSNRTLNYSYNPLSKTQYILIREFKIKKWFLSAWTLPLGSLISVKCHILITRI